MEKEHLAAQGEPLLESPKATTPKQRQKQSVLELRHVLQDPTQLPELEQWEKQPVLHTIVCSVNLLPPVQRLLADPGEMSPI